LFTFRSIMLAVLARQHDRFPAINLPSLPNREPPECKTVHMVTGHCGLRRAARPRRSCAPPHVFHGQAPRARSNV